MLLHGFTQTGRSWQQITPVLASEHEVVAPDLPGHGEDESASAAASPPDAASLLADTCGGGTWIGYSMGGRYALHVAVQRPDVVHGLVLVSTTAGIDDPADRAARRAADEARAEAIERDGVDSFLTEWLAQPLFAGLDTEAADIGDRRRNAAAGLASSLRLAGTGAQEPLWDRLGEIGAAGIPVLVVAGGDDKKFREIGQRLVMTIGSSAEMAVLAHAGHAPQLERPDAFVDLLRAWLGAHKL